MSGAYIERKGAGVEESRLHALRDKWTLYRVNDVFDHVGEVLVDHATLPREDAQVGLVDTLDIGALLFPPMWRLSTPRITTSWRYHIWDPRDINVIDNSMGTLHFSDAYTLGLTQEGFYGKYESEKENLLGSTREIRGYEDLLRMVDKHLEMGRENRLKEWGRE
jgi:hypothetical protein